MEDKIVIYDLLNKLSHRNSVKIVNEIQALILLKKDGHGIYIDYNNRPESLDLFLDDYQLMESLESSFKKNIIIINIKNKVLIDQYVGKINNITIH